MNFLTTDAAMTLGLIVKIMTILALVVYAVFALVLISQIRIKRKTVATELGSFLELLSYLHAGLSILLIIVAFIIL